MENQKCANPNCQSKPDVKVRRCSGCLQVYYCSVECQVMDRKKHKLICKKELSKKLLDEIEETKRIGAGIKPGMFIYNPVFNIPSSLLSLSNFQQILNSFSCGLCQWMYVINTSKLPGSDISRFYECESHFVEMFKNFKDNQAFFFGNSDVVGLFESDKNSVFAERSIGIMGTLATIFRQRGEIELCEDVLKIDSMLFSCYSASVKRSKDRDAIICEEGLRYKYNMIKFNLLSDKLRHKKICLYVFEEEVVVLFRQLLYYEIDYQYDFEEQNLLFCLRFLKIFSSQQIKFTKRNLDDVTDLELLSLLKYIESRWGEKYR